MTTLRRLEFADFRAPVTPSPLQRRQIPPSIQRSSNHRSPFKRKNQPIMQNDISICMLLTPLIFLHFAKIPKLELDSHIYQKIITVFNTKSQVDVITRIRRAVDSIHTRLTKEYTNFKIPDTIKQKIRYILNSHNYTSYEVFTAYMIAMYANNDNNFQTKEDQFEETYPDKVCTSNAETNERHRISRIRITMGDQINFDDFDDSELQYFLSEGEHEIPQLPPFAVYDMLTKTLNFKESVIDEFESQKWWEGDDDVLYVFSPQDKIEDIIKTQINELQNEKVLCKGGMIKSKYYKHIRDEYESFNHVFAFIYKNETIYVYDTLDDTTWGMKLSDWQGIQETSDGYRKVIIGACAFLHSKEAFPEETAEGLHNIFKTMSLTGR